MKNPKCCLCGKVCKNEWGNEHLLLKFAPRQKGWFMATLSEKSKTTNSSSD